MQFTENDSNIVIILPSKHKCYFTSIFRQDKIETKTENPQRIWVGILNRHLLKSVVKQKHRPLGFFVIKSSDKTDIEHEATTLTKNKANNSKKISKTQNSIWRFFKQV